MPDHASTANLDNSVAERIDRIREEIERIIPATGEHSDCELKTNWLQNTPYHKAEVIKDIQAIANSNIAPGSDKYIVIGVDEQTRTYTGCNHDDYLDYVFPTLQLIAENLITGKNNLFALDEGLGKLLQGIEPSRREIMFGNYLLYAERRRYEQCRFPRRGSVYWPEPLQNLIEKARAQDTH